MAKTKVDPNLDVTTQDQALTNEDVDAQDARTRLWQSYNTTYNAKIRDSDKAYDRNISEADNAALARGMGRSSYALQTRANIGQEKINAQNNINSEKIAAYQQALNNLEDKEREQANWEAQFNLTKDQFAYQQGRDKIADEQWQKQFDEGIRQFNAQLNAAGGSGGGGGYRGGGGGYSRGGTGGTTGSTDGTGGQNATWESLYGTFNNDLKSGITAGMNSLLGTLSNVNKEQKKKQQGISIIKPTQKIENKVSKK